VADADDRLAAAARAAGIEVSVQADPKLVAASEIAEGTDLIVTAHSHARISREALAAAQEWCFVKKGETARELWERALAPLGQKLLGEVVDYAKIHKALPGKPQDEQFATKAPSLP
jgi:methionyl-tRNA formyltransferase